MVTSHVETTFRYGSDVEMAEGIAEDYGVE